MAYKIVLYAYLPKKIIRKTKTFRFRADPELDPDPIFFSAELDLDPRKKFRLSFLLIVN